MTYNIETGLMHDCLAILATVGEQSSIAPARVEENIESKVTSLDSETSMAAAIRALELLKLELPDPDRELSPQNISLHTFTCFQKLPIELRLIIWKIALPGRQAVSVQFCQRPRHPMKNPPNPVTLHINQESRDLTLEHYMVIFQWQRFCQKERAVYFNPETDLVFMETYSPLTDEFEERSFCAFEENLEAFAAVRRLEVREGWWSPYSQQWQEGDSGGGLKYFTGLKELHITMCHQFCFSPRPGAFYQNFRAFIDSGQEYKPESQRSAPKIIFHHWRPMKVRSDQENLHEAATVYL